MSTPAGNHRPEFRRSCPSRLPDVDHVCQDLRRFLVEQREAESGFVVELVARESLNNAVLHGNCEQAARSVFLRFRVYPDHFCLQVRDEGPGFNWRGRIHAPIPDDFTVRGRGIPILEMYAQRLRFNEAGNSVTIRLAKSRTED